jgi:hypothetical protein
MLRRRRALALPLSLLAVVPAATVLLASTAIVLGEDCSSDGAGATPSSTAEQAIPKYLLAVYHRSGSD